jgi:hypothetical protein
MNDTQGLGVQYVAEMYSGCADGEGTEVIESQRYPSSWLVPILELGAHLVLLLFLNVHAILQTPEWRQTQLHRCLPFLEFSGFD